MRELADTPLMLSIMILAYAETPSLNASPPSPPVHGGESGFTHVAPPSPPVYGGESGFTHVAPLVGWRLRSIGQCGWCVSCAGWLLGAKPASSTMLQTASFCARWGAAMSLCIARCWSTLQTVDGVRVIGLTKNLCYNTVHILNIQGVSDVPNDRCTKRTRY